jgi:hypothetical protein
MKSDQLLACLSSWLNQCLMRRAPQDDPLSWSAMSWALAAYLVTDLLQARSSSGWSMSLAMTLVDTLVMVLFARVVLLVVKKTARFVQTLTSLAGTGAILGLVGLPLVQMAEQSRQVDEPMGALVWGWLLLLGWSIAVQAHIFRHALSTGIGAGLFVACLHLALVISLFRALFPEVSA